MSAIATIDPIVLTGVLAVAGSLLTRIALRSNSTGRLIGQTLFLATLTAVLVRQGIGPFQAAPLGTTPIRHAFAAIAKMVWWINAAWALIAFVRAFLVMEHQPRQGRLVQDLVVAVIYLGALLSVLAYVFDIPVGTLVATSGVVAIILGLALQSTLSDVFSGIALNIGRPYALGDWIVLNGGIEGRVVETNWRATHLLNGSNDLVVLPNSSLAKATLTNMSSPDRSHGAKLPVAILPTRAPRVIVEAMREVLLSCNGILKTPAPSVQVKSLSGAAVEVELSFRVSDISQTTAAKNELFDLIYRHVLAHGLKLAAPAEAAWGMLAGPSDTDATPTRQGGTPLRLLQQIQLFATLTEVEKETLAAGMVRHAFRQGETIVDEGAARRSLMIVRSGVALVTRAEGGRDVELDRLAPGDCFGEGGLLTGATEPGKVTAMTLVVVYEIAQATLAPLLQARPSVADDLALLLARRMGMDGRPPPPSGSAVEPGSVQRLVERIRHLFDLRHGPRH